MSKCVLQREGGVAKDGLKYSSSVCHCCSQCHGGATLSGATLALGVWDVEVDLVGHVCVCACVFYLLQTR